MEATETLTSTVPCLPNESCFNCSTKLLKFSKLLIKKRVSAALKVENAVSLELNLVLSENMSKVCILNMKKDFLAK